MELFVSLSDRAGSPVGEKKKTKAGRAGQSQIRRSLNAIL